jgi:Rieske Fe-S protein
MSRLTRRTTLKLAASGAVVMAIGAACQTDSAAPKVDEVRVGPEELPDRASAPFHSMDGRFYLFLRENEPIALYTRCTHRSCLVRWENDDSEFQCPCHGSRFDRDGLVINGPAERPLERMTVEQMEDGSVVVFTGERYSGAT